MTNHMSEGITPFTNVFGWAQTKIEGRRLSFDLGAVDDPFAEVEQTFWLERPFTKDQFCRLADLLESSSEYFIRELGQVCREHSINGYGTGF